MAKKKVKKSSVKKAAIKKLSKDPKRKMTRAGWFFINLLLFVMFLYAGYLIWAVDPTRGFSLIVALLIIIFVIRLFRKIKKK